MPASGGARERLDVLLVRRGLFATRERARAAVLAGRVRVEGVPVTKAGAAVPEAARIEVLGKDLPYVSRAGLKLEKALDTFSIDPTGRVCLDVGASTGGFTDCLLQRGAARVYAVDVGYGQLAWPLRRDPRVVVLERTNARHLTRREVPEPIDLAAVDVSFISLLKILPAVAGLLRAGGEVVALVKPQFEAGPEQVGKKGVVRDPAVHRQVLDRVLAGAEDLGFAVLGLTHSPLRGDEGNIEFLAWLGWPAAAGTPRAPRDRLVAAVVSEAQRRLTAAGKGGEAREP